MCLPTYLIRKFYRFNIILVKSTMPIFVEIEKLIPQLTVDLYGLKEPNKF